jgi:excisionase family DNA binding protein
METINSTPAPKRRRGRPRKHPLPIATTTHNAEVIANAVVRESADINNLDKLADAITMKLRATIDAAAAKQPTITEPLLITSKQAAQILAVSEGTIWNLMADGRLSFVHIAGSRRVSIDTVKRLAATGTAA